ncbi:MAG: nuclear transport factor 2 family protein [Myxococcota bacterium]
MNTIFNHTGLVLIAALAMAGCAGNSDTTLDDNPQNTDHQETDMTAKAITLKAFDAIFRDFDPEAARALLAEDYIQHNVSVPTGATPVLAFIPDLKASGITPTTHRVIAEGDLVVMHNTYTQAQAFGAETLVAFDIFRVENGKLAEHWDNLQPPPTQTASGRSMTDGATTIEDRELTAQNKARVEAFARDVLLGGQFDKAADYIIATPGAYIQHNPDIPDGLDGLAEAFGKFAEAGQALNYTKVHAIVAEGNFVFMMSEGTLGDTPTAFFDLLRVEDGMIVEHWDTIATIPPASEMPHNNGKF